MKFDIGRFWGGRVRFFTLSLRRPSFSRTAAAVRRKHVTSSEVFDEVGKLRLLPKRELNKFNSVAAKARTALAAYSVPGFPFIASNVHPVLADRIDAMQKEMNAHFLAFEEAKKSLIERLPEIKEEIHRAYRQFAQSDRAVELHGTVEAAEEYYAAFVEESFPEAARIEREYRFLLDDHGAIEKAVGLFTREELVNDAESEARLELVQFQKRAAQEQISEWIAQQAAQVRVGLLKAIWPHVRRLREGMAVTPAVADRILGDVEKVMNHDLFGDKKVGEVVHALRKAVNDAKAKGTFLSAEMAKIGMEDALAETGKALQNLAAGFEEQQFRLIEVESDAFEPVRANADAMREIQERIREHIKAAPENAAERPEDAKILQVLLGIQESGDAERAEQVLHIAERFARLDVETEDEANAPNPEVEAAIERAIELDSDPDQDAVPVAADDSDGNVRLIELD